MHLERPATPPARPGQRVKFLRTCQERDTVGNLWAVDVGDVLEVPSFSAVRLISDGWAEAVETSPSKK